jgi:hypothetical protein
MDATKSPLTGNGKAAVMAASHETDLRFGVNYLPSEHWWYSWLEWDAASVLDDLRSISSLGMDHIRIQLLWPVFQPDPAVVNPAALERLCELMDLADHPHVSMDVSVSVLDGWLSGLTFLSAFNGDVSPESGDRWASLLLDHCERIAPGRFHVNGVDHQPWFQARTFSPTAAAAYGSASILHAHPYRARRDRAVRTGRHRCPAPG